MAIPASLSLQSTPNSFDYAAVVTMSNGDNCTFNWHGATTMILPIRCTKVLSTGTTAAANYVALY